MCSFDRCYGGDATQDTIFYQEIEPLLKISVLKGVNATIFCYGMTGAGKTHTMQGTPKEPGIYSPNDVFIFLDITSQFII
jgi:hypothetical protein